MSDHIDELSKALAAVPKINVAQGIYVGPIDGQQWVDIDDRIAVTLWCPEPQVGDRVYVLFINGPGYVTGMVTPPPTTGTVTTTGGTLVKVDADQGEFTVPYLTGYAPVMGDVVQLGYTRTAGLHIIGVLSEKIPEPAPPVAPAGTPVRPPSLITATWSGSVKTGNTVWFTNQVWASPGNIGAYGYGSKVRDTFDVYGIPARTEIYLPAIVDKVGNNRLGWHPLETRADVAPTITGPRTVRNGWVDISDLATQLSTGGGIGFDGAGNTTFQGVPYGGQPGDTQAGALRLTYN